MTTSTEGCQRLLTGRKRNILLIILASSSFGWSQSANSLSADHILEAFDWGSYLKRIYEAPGDIHGLTGDFGCQNWHLFNTTINGSGACDSLGLTIIGGDSPYFQPGQTGFSISNKNEISVGFYFDWNYSTSDESGPFYDQLKVVSPIDKKLSNDIGPGDGIYSGPKIQSGKASVTTNSKSLFSIAIDTNDGQVGGAQARVGNFTASYVGPIIDEMIEKLAIDGLTSAFDYISGTSGVAAFLGVGGDSCQSCQVEFVGQLDAEAASEEQQQEFLDDLIDACQKATGKSQASCKSEITTPQMSIDPSLTYPGAVLRENSPAYLSFHLAVGQLPAGSDFIIPIMPLAVGDGDVLTIWAGSTLLWGSFGQNLNANEVYLVSIDGNLLENFDGDLSFILMSIGESQAQFFVPDLAATGFILSVDEPAEFYMLLFGMLVIILCNQPSVGLVSKRPA